MVRWTFSILSFPRTFHFTVHLKFKLITSAFVVGVFQFKSYLSCLLHQRVMEKWNVPQCPQCHSFYSTRCELFLIPLTKETIIFTVKFSQGWFQPAWKLPAANATAVWPRPVLPLLPVCKNKEPGNPVPGGQLQPAHSPACCRSHPLALAWWGPTSGSPGSSPWWWDSVPQ